MSRRFAILWLLYLVQGLPFGFQATAMPVLLREADASLTVVSLAGLVSIPWVLKPLWAPWVDASRTRKRWLLPMQAALALSVGLAGWVGDTQLAPLVICVALMNLFAATLDIAVDGLAVDMLKERDLGLGNAAQVVGYKLGMLVGGGLVLWASAHVGHARSMYAMVAVILVVLAVTWRFDEPPRQTRAQSGIRLSYLAAMKKLLATFRAPETKWVAIAAITYKAGEAMADTMFKPFMVDHGFTRAEIGLWLGTWGMLFSLAGSLGGGWLASRWKIWHALAVFAALRILPLLGQWWLAVGGAPDATSLIAITCAEHLFGGALTTAMFAMMMSRVDRKIGATHYTALAALEVIGKAIPGLASGPLTEKLGYAATFGAAVALSMVFLLVLPALRKSALGSVSR
jgi:MFS family permease